MGGQKGNLLESMWGALLSNYVHFHCFGACAKLCKESESCVARFKMLKKRVLSESKLAETA